MVIEKEETRIKNVLLLKKSKFLLWNHQVSVKTRPEGCSQEKIQYYRSDE